MKAAETPAVGAEAKRESFFRTPRPSFAQKINVAKLYIKTSFGPELLREFSK
jgi:hypothetical protein